MKRPFIANLLTKRFWLPLMAGGMVMQVSFGGCDPTVRDTVLSGIQTSIITLTTALFTAFFQALSNAGSSTSQPVVEAGFEFLKNWLA